MTFVKWRAPNVDNEQGEDAPTLKGRYSFPRKIPLAHEINLTFESKHLHDHRCHDEVFRKRLCKYKETKEEIRIGRVIFQRLPLQWDQKRVDFNPAPQVFDPCVVIKKHIKL